MLPGVLDGPPAAQAQAPAARRIGWSDVPGVHQRLQARGITAASFSPFIERLRSTHADRVREGDLDHLVFYVLQSTHFTSEAALEPALSAKDLVGRLSAPEREAFLRDGSAPASRIPLAVRSRIDAFLRAVEKRESGEPRLVYFRGLVATTFGERGTRADGLMREYLRAMRFVYLKEFVAQRGADAPGAVAELYRSRGLSTDTAVEAGYLVHLGLGVVKGLDPQRRIRRVLIIGPGLDLAPRTAFVEAAPPESYQPWAVIDALLALGLASADDLEVVAADINPRVVDHLRRSGGAPPVLRLVSEIGDTGTISLSGPFRDYFGALGTAVGDAGPVTRGTLSGPGGAAHHLLKTVRVSPQAARTLTPALLDVVTERLEPSAFDLALATNILPYFDDTELALAIENVAAMIVPGGVFMHNEARPAMQDLTAAAGLPFEQSRHAVIATVRGAPPLGDSVFIHRRSGRN